MPERKREKPVTTQEVNKQDEKEASRTPFVNPRKMPKDESHIVRTGGAPRRVQGRKKKSEEQ
jgi:hypothetical protein